MPPHELELLSQRLLKRERILLIVAHPDDEAIGAGILLQRYDSVQVVFCTSGAPNNIHIWRRFGTPWHYARIREREAKAALSIVHNTRFTFLRFRDGTLYRSLPALYRRLSDIVKSSKPACIVTHAYEGGHQDHDVCSFLSWRLSESLGVQVYELPLYHPNWKTGDLIYQTFPQDGSLTEILQPTPTELEAKQSMFAAHKSQAHVLKDFSASRETFRPQMQYDYLRPAIQNMSKMGVSEVAPEELTSAFRTFMTAE